MNADILHSTVTGQGLPIVMLHGYLSSGQYFKHIRKRLETSHQIITLDLLGFGRSPKPKVRYTYEDHCEAIRRTLEQLDIPQPFVLLGHSMGALIALRYATAHSDSIKQLLLFNMPIFTDTSQMITHHIATGKRYRIMLYSRGRHIYWLTLRLLPKSKSRRRPAISLSDIISMSPAAREGSYRNIIGGAAVFTDLRRVTVPTLLVNGRYDRAVYLENMRGKSFPPNVQVQTIESGHHPLVRDLEVAEHLIRSYLVQ